MPFSTDDTLMLRSIITDHYQHPRNFKKLDDDSYITIHMDSASCIDDIYIQVKIVEEKIVDLKWYGNGCAISTASTSIMSELVLDKTIDEALKIKEEFDKMLEGQDFDDEMIEDAICFCNVNRQPSRITCANISWRGLKKAIDCKEKR